jgi:hypothetical protein
LRIALPFAIAGLAFSIWAMWGAGIEASGLSLVLMLTGLPVYARRTERDAIRDMRGFTRTENPALRPGDTI